MAIIMVSTAGSIVPETVDALGLSVKLEGTIP